MRGTLTWVFHARAVKERTISSEATTESIVKQLRHFFKEWLNGGDLDRQNIRLVLMYDAQLR